MTQHLPRLARIVLLLGSVVLPQGTPLAAMAAGALDRADAPDSKLSRIKDVASVEGVRDNQLIGYGLVVGLRNSGDSQQTGFSVQTLLATLQRMGVNMGATNTNAIRVQNTAAVFVTAVLPPFAQPGTKIDVTVSSAGDARSLEGGLLLLTPLYGADGKVYAAAQGALVLGGYSVAANGNAQRTNHPTTGRIPDGAMTEHAVPLDLAGKESVTLLLSQADFKSADTMAAAINRDLGQTRARALDARRVALAVLPGEDIPSLLARVEMLPVKVYTRARVIVNERTGTVVIGGDVRLSPVSILHGGLAINVETQVSAVPSVFGPATTVAQTSIQAQEKRVDRIQLKANSTVDDLVRGLQSIGATARDVISILQAMKQAGALEADLEVI